MDTADIFRYTKLQIYFVYVENDGHVPTLGLVRLVYKAGHLGFAVLQCSFKN